MEVHYLPNGLLLCQHKLTKDLLKDHPVEKDKRAFTSLPIHLKLSALGGDLLEDPTPCRSLVRKLNILTNTRPDLAYAIQTLSQFMQKPRSSHWQALHHTLSYVSHTCGQGIFLRASNKITIQAFSASDWGSCIDSRRSVTGYLIMLGQSAISWKSKKQNIVSRSSSEAEYRAMASTAAEITWIVRLIEELSLTNLRPITLHCDNQSAIHIAKNPVFHGMTKHIEVDCHFTILEGLIQLSYSPTRNQLADVLTKIIPSSQFNNLLDKLEMVSPHSSLRGMIRIALRIIKQKPSRSVS